MSAISTVYIYMKFDSINPYNGEVVGSYNETTKAELSEILDSTATAFDKWRKVPLNERTRLLANAGKVLRDNVDRYAKMITLEMGKPIAESRAEVKKCALACDYYAENAADFLADQHIKTEASQSFVRHNPIGCVFAVMPWNFPFWQVFRFAAPTLTSGNTAILKHAKNVFGCATMIAEVFDKAGYPKNVFQNAFIGHDKAEMIIAHSAVKAVTLTGSEKAGSAIAQLAGKHLKKSLLELGGSNAFVVLADADMDKTIATAVNARMMNTGQSCIAAKRFIIEEKIYDEFVEKFTKAVIELKSGDPLDEDTQIGPLARIDLAETAQKQVKDSIKKGAKLLLGGKQLDAYHEPTILGDVKPGMPAFDEETFGPVAAIIKAIDIEQAFKLSQATDFALGISVCTENIKKALEYVDYVSDGAYFVNDLVKSDPRLPFGGQKNSGYGRELSRDGMMEFINRKTVFVK